jgi:hypothetical protein
VIAVAEGSNEQVFALTAEQDAQYAAWIKSCTDHYQPAHMICGPVPGGFDGDEEVLAVFPDVNLMELRAVRYSRGTYGGPPPSAPPRACRSGSVVPPVAAKAWTSCARSISAPWC